MLETLISIDKLLNAMTGGICSHTISGRVGDLSSGNRRKSFWRVMEAIINWSFSPVMPNHCKEVKKYEPLPHDSGPIVLLLILLVGCIIVSPVIRVITTIDSRSSK